jgi:alpha-tubulin suppressor-like RCC1 family protein
MMHATIESLDGAANSKDLPVLSNKIYLDVTELAISEGSAAIINVALSEKHDQDIQVSVSINDVNNRFQPITSTLTIPAQTLSKPIVLQSIDDNIYQGSQVISLTISPLDQKFTADPNILTINLVDNDAAPIIQVLDVSTNENNSPMKFSVSLNRESIYPTEFDYSIQNITATLGADFTDSGSGHFIIPAGQVSAELQFLLVNDTSSETNETFSLLLANPIQGTLANSSATGTIIDDDDVYISVNDQSVIENSGTATFTISLNKVTANNVSVNWATANGTASSGVNYTVSSGTAIIAAGNTSITITVPIIDTTSVCEGDRNFYVNLSSGVNAIIQDNQGIGTIQENDVPTVSIGNVNASESSVAAVPVTLSQSCSLDVSFSYTMSDGTAGASDYVGMSSTFTVKAGNVNALLGVTTLEDVLIEGNENLNLTIVSPVNATLGTSSSVITIQDNDVPLAVTNNITQISAGPRQVCAIRGGGAFCWGGNGNGDLGNGTTTPRYYPTQVTGLTFGVTKIVSGGLFYIDERYGARVCAIHSGAAKCWGNQSMGELGNNLGSSSSVPTNVVGLSTNVTDIDTSDQAYGGFSCAVHSGAAKCWGNNSVGQLGDGTTTVSVTPVTVSGLSSGVSKIATGETHACAVLIDGTVKCWGNNSNGQLGDGTTTSSLVPVTVSGIASGATKISLGFRHSCALVSGGVKCWGANGSGQLGNGTTVASSTPVDATGLTSGVTDVTASGDAVGGVSGTCAIDSLGAVKCWGGNNYGQLGDGTTTSKTVPTQVTGLTSGFTQVSANVGTVCAVKSDGKSYCWGDYTVGQLSGDVGGFLYSPKDPIGLSGLVSSVSVGLYFSCAIHNGAAKCWGANSYGNLGNGNYTNQGSPVQVTGLTSGVTSIATDADNYYSNRHACAVHNGAAKCWGDNSNGQLGNGVTGGSSNVPVQVTGLASGVLSVAVSMWHSCAVLIDGTMKCWGNNSHGQLGDGTTNNSNVPVSVVDVSAATETSIASRYSCAIDGGAMKCWGLNANGQLGDGTAIDKLTAGIVTGLSSGVTSISTQAYDTTNSFSCAVQNGSAKCWGYGYNGRLGTGNGSSQNVPTQVSGFTSNVKKIVTHTNGGCLLTNSGAVHCWGINSALILSPTFSLNFSFSPVANSFITTGAIDISTGGNGACAITTSNSLKCWGNYLNSGTGSTTAISTVPVEILFPPEGS